MALSLHQLLQHCTVKLIPAQNRSWGTGFFVTPGQIITCAHVVQEYETENIPVFWQGQVWSTATVEQISPALDLAILRVESSNKDFPPCVLLGETFKPFDRIYVYGYPDDFPDGGSVTIQCEGDVREEKITLIKAQAGQIRPGHSGSPALNFETGTVCGIVSDTRGRSTDLGGFLIPIATVFTHFPELRLQNQAAHSLESPWLALQLPVPLSPVYSPIPTPQFSTYNPATFAGRKTETAELTTRLQEGCRIIAIVGMTGIGKTALGERVIANLMKVSAVNLLPYYRFNLDDHSLTPDFANSGAALLRILGEEPTLDDQRDPANLLIHLLNRLKSYPCRVQIDSLEQLLRGNEQNGWSKFSDPLWLDFLKQFLSMAYCPSQLLLTSQDIPSDLDIVASRTPQFWHCYPLQGLILDDQKELFQNRGLSLTSIAWNYLTHISKFYNGHPLVLQVIADEICQAPFQGNIIRYWQHYKAEFNSTATPTNKLARNRLFRRRIRQQVEQTLERLPNSAHQMLLGSAVFRRPVPIEFWYTMLSHGNPETAFATLQDRHLVEYSFSSNNTLLVRQHNLIRSIAYDLLKTDSVKWEAAERLAAHIWTTIYEPASNVSSLENVRGYLEAFNHYCTVGDYQSATNIMWNEEDESNNIQLEKKLANLGYHQELLSLYKNLKSPLMSSSNQKLKANFQAYLGRTHFYLYNYEKAILYLQDAIEKADKINEKRIKGVALGFLGVTYSTSGDYEKSLACHEEALSIFQELNDVEEEGSSLGNLGFAYLRKGSCRKSLSLFKQQMEIAQAVNDIPRQCTALRNIGLAYETMRRYKKAIIYCQKAVEVSTSINYKVLEMSSHVNLGRIHYKIQQYHQSISHFEKALEVSKNTKKYPLSIECLYSLGTIYAEIGEYLTANKVFEELLEISTRTGNHLYQGMALINIGTSQLHVKQYSESLNKYQLALSIFQQIGDLENEVKVLKNIGELYRAQDNLKEARRYFQQALALAANIESSLEAECKAILRQIK